ncbi:MAG: short-chain dehydrogenase [Bacteroidetes bacterium]|nr:short-chain dehydrogenase [Bacteroidota bacterium]
MKKVIIVGASSGIGRDLAIEMSKRGYELGLTARRLEMLQEVAKDCPSKTYVKTMDMEKHDEARILLGDLIEEMGGVDIIVYNAGIGESSGKWVKENQVHQVNAVGFAAIANYAFKYFKDNKIKGQIVGISSIAGVRGSRHVIGYSATKAFMSTYMAGQRHKSIAEKLGITVTDIRPGFVETPMTKGQKGMFWVQPADKAARQIADAIEAKKKVVYITRRWWLIALFTKLTPEYFWNRF